MSDPLVGTRLDGQYDLLELIGQGGMGRVYRAIQQPLGRSVAVKIMADRPAADTNGATRFRREAQALSRLSHPNIVAIHGFGRTDDGWLYLVLEHVIGVNLEEVIEQDEDLDLHRFAAIAEQVAAAVAKAHSQGIIHRDLKPSNVILTGVAGRDEQVKLLDFGLARAFVDDAELGQVTADDVVVGTSGYLSPEQLRMEELGPATDVWALAVLMYRAVTGVMPFRGSKAEVLDRTLDKHPAEPSTFRKDLPRAADRAILWGLNKRPEDRPASVIDLARAFADGVGAQFSVEQGHLATVPVQPIVVVDAPTVDVDVTVAAVPTSLPSTPVVHAPTMQSVPVLPQRRRSTARLVVIVAALSALVAGVAAYIAVRA